MKLLLTMTLVLTGFPLFAQAPAAADNSVTQDHSALGVQPGPEVLKPKDLYDATGYFHPFVRMPKYVWNDQKAIWTSPFHTSKKDAIGGPFSGAPPWGSLPAANRL